MCERSCCGFGHRDMFKNIDAVLRQTLVNLIKQENVTLFYIGGMGEFDKIFSSTVRGLKRSFPDIKLVLVKPYFSNELNTNKEYYENTYDGIYIPEESATTFHKKAITVRNRWMVDNADFIISGVYKDYGGAYDAVRYAQQNKKIVFKLFEFKK